VNSVTYPFLQARNYTRGPRNGPIDLIIFHDMESPETVTTAESCAAYFAGANAPQASCHYCLAPGTLLLTDDLRWVPVEDLGIGDGVVGVDEFARGKSGRSWRSGAVTSRAERETDLVRVVLVDGRSAVSSADHLWLACIGGHKLEWVAADALRPGDEISAPLTPWPSTPDTDLIWFGGILDGEGSWTVGNDLCFSQKDGRVFDRARAILEARDLPYTFDKRPNGVNVLRLSGVRTMLSVLGQARPERFIDSTRWHGRALRSRVYDHKAKIAVVESARYGPVVSLGTSIRTLVANGIVGHNCVDSDSIVQSVRDSDIAWHCPGANHNGIGIEHAGYARQTREEWLDDYGVAMLRRSAALVVDLCDTYDIPPVWLSADDVRAGRRGIATHRVCTAAFRTAGGHTDPGPNFPSDVYMGYVLDASRAKWPVTPPKNQPLPAVEVAPMINPPLHADIVAWCKATDGGVLLLDQNGGILNFGVNWNVPAGYLFAPTQLPADVWEGRTPATITWNTDGTWTVTATDGAGYTFPTPPPAG
jgi:hypothetical protein